MPTFDGEGAVLGRLSSKVAKMLLSGEEVVVVNADKVIVTGNPKFVTNKYISRLDIGSPIHGPFWQKRADMLLRRAIRGMVPNHKANGRAALKRLRVYKDRPAEITGEVMTMKKEIRSRSITLGEIAKAMCA